MADSLRRHLAGHRRRRARDLLLFRYGDRRDGGRAIRRPTRGVRQTTSTVIWRIPLFFVGGVLIIVTVVPWNQLPNPKGDRAVRLHLPTVRSARRERVHDRGHPHRRAPVLNSGLYSAARMFAALADDGFAPGVVAKRARGVPFVAVLASTLGGFMPRWPSTTWRRRPESSDFIMNSAGLVATVRVRVHRADAG